MKKNHQHSRVSVIIFHTHRYSYQLEFFNDLIVCDKGYHFSYFRTLSVFWNISDSDRICFFCIIKLLNSDIGVFQISLIDLQESGSVCYLLNNMMHVLS